MKVNSSPDTTVVEDWLYTTGLKEGAKCTVVDNIGIGAGVYFALRKRTTCRKGDARERAKDEVRFFNRRAEAYWTVRDLFEAGSISIPEDQELINELSAITYDPSNRNKIGDKKDLRKKLGGASPDKADALALSYYVDDRQFASNKRQSNTINWDEVYLR
jgi:hypothetical protein